MFSELIDIVIARSGRPDRFADAVSYSNQTIRDVQAKGFCWRNRIEAEIVTDADPFLWPTPVNFQSMGFFRYPNNVYPRTRLGLNQEETRERYYGGPGYIGFTGHGAGAIVQTLYYSFRARLQYYVLDARPATVIVDPDTDALVWTYNTVGSINYNSTPALQLRAQQLVSNWVLERWNDMVQEGTLAKLFKLIGEDSRAATAYALFQQIRAEQFIPAEIRESVPGQDHGNN